MLLAKTFSNWTVFSNLFSYILVKNYALLDIAILPDLSVFLLWKFPDINAANTKLEDLFYKFQILYH
jgi:hypothetical protein